MRLLLPLPSPICPSAGEPLPHLSPRPAQGLVLSQSDSRGFWALETLCSETDVSRWANRTKLAKNLDARLCGFLFADPPTGQKTKKDTLPPSKDFMSYSLFAFACPTLDVFTAVVSLIRHERHCNPGKELRYSSHRSVLIISYLSSICPPLMTGDNPTVASLHLEGKLNKRPKEQMQQKSDQKNIF